MLRFLLGLVLLVGGVVAMVVGVAACAGFAPSGLGVGAGALLFVLGVVSAWLGWRLLSAPRRGGRDDGLDLADAVDLPDFVDSV